MKMRFSRKQLWVMIIISFLVVVSTYTYLIREGFWANINSRGMIRLAKEDWASGEYISSINWYRSAYSSALYTGVRWEILKIYDYRMDKLRKQGKLSDALDVCRQAEMIWNQEGATSYTCLTIEQELLDKQ